jgi:hypothetical protein
MKAFLKAASIGGLVLVFAGLNAGAGHSQTNAPAPASQAQAPAAETAPASSGADAGVSAADIKANPDCKSPADIACAWSHCYPLTNKWRSTSACIGGSCKIRDQSCTNDLIQDVLDPDREKTHGG